MSLKLKCSALSLTFRKGSKFCKALLRKSLKHQSIESIYNPDLHLSHKSQEMAKLQKKAVTPHSQSIPLKSKSLYIALIKSIILFSKPTQLISMHSAKSCIPGKALHYKGPGNNFKASDFHFTCPLFPEKGGQRSSSVPIYNFKDKSALDFASRE